MFGYIDHLNMYTNSCILPENHITKGKPNKARLLNTLLYQKSNK